MSRPGDYKNNQFKHTIFIRIQEEINKQQNSADLVALHVGDSWFDLPEELNIPLENEPWNNRMSRYGDTMGEIELRKLLARKVIEKNNLPLRSEKEIQLTFGATGALFIAMQKLLEEGDEVLVLSPQWTILKVVASTAKVKMIEVPFFDKLSHNPDADILEWIRPYLSDKTRALYFNSPNNPSGVLLKEQHIEQLADFAKKHDLWVLSDEAYEDFVWTDDKYVSIGSLPEMYDRTISIFSFSKSYAGAGLRLGYIAAPEGVIAALNPAHVGVGYEANRPSQVMGIRGLHNTEPIVSRIRSAYREGLAVAEKYINVPYLKPEGSFYLFLDLRDRWAGLNDDQKLARMIKAGVVLSPGAPFGAAYDGWARFCFTSEAPELIAEAAKRVADL